MAGSSENLPFPKLKGIYIDLSGKSPADMRIIMAESCNGRIITTPLCTQGCRMSVMLDFITADEWLAIIDQMHGGKRKTA